MRKEKACTYCYIKTRQWHLHHKDRNKKNNHESNLRVLCHSCHSSDHGEDKDNYKHDLVNAIDVSKYGLRLIEGFNLLDDEDYGD